MPNPSDPWRPTASIETLKARAQILRQVRQFFDERGFFEVQTPCLSNETVVDAHLDPLPVRLQSGRTMYLQTSPEAAMKRLVAAGARAIYQIGPVFRGDEVGPLHNPEFTMLEWYRRDDSMHDGIALLDDLVTATTAGGPARRMTYRALFSEMFGFDPIDSPLGEIRNAIERSAVGYQVTESDSRDDLLDVLMGLAIQPRLRGIVIVSNYPISQAALARRSDADPATAERFELFIDGVEIANGYAELQDPRVLVARTEDQNASRITKGRGRLPTPEKLIAAMRHGLPRCSGTALGLDRLVMIAAGATMIDQVIPFPHQRA